MHIYRPAGDVVFMRRTDYSVGLGFGGCRCGRARAFVWDAGRELCDGCQQPPGTCDCTPVWAVQLGLRPFTP